MPLKILKKIFTRLDSWTYRNFLASERRLRSADMTQAIVNPSFEQDLDGAGTYTYTWTFTGNGLVEDNTNNEYQSYDGTHFA